jgi:hypothetical protein
MKMKLHENLKWSTILRRIEKKNNKKFKIDEAYNNVYELDQNSKSYYFVCKTFENTNLARIMKRDFINNYQ